MRENDRIKLEVQQAEKLRLVSELAASVAHEMRNPMTVVRGFLQLFKMDKVILESHSKYLDIAIAELDRAEAIITDYLSFAKQQTSQAERIELGHVIEQVIEIMTPLSHYHNVSIDKRIEHNCYVYADVSKMMQCIINILKNSIEAMPNGGELVVQLYAEEQQVLIVIEDNGVGMTQEQLARLGKPFNTTKKDGTGLGMVVVYSIIESLQGKIAVKSEEGNGTQISITLPKRS